MCKGRLSKAEEEIERTLGEMPQKTFPSTCSGPSPNYVDGYSDGLKLALQLVRISLGRYKKIKDKVEFVL